jgi:hypothetical protein
MVVKHVLNLGAGVQSTTLYLMSMEGLAPAFDACIFADTQEEPEAVYRHMEWLKTLNGPPIMVCTKGSLGDNLLFGRAHAGIGFASIPGFILNKPGAANPVGRTRRQCSREFKIEVIEQAIRYQVLGLAPKRRVPKHMKIHQYFGISLDEKSRATRIWERYHIDRESIGEPHFPLIDKQMTRANCLAWLDSRVPHKVPKSACTFCPFRDDSGWQELKDAGGHDWNRIVQIDHALRSEGALACRDLDGNFFLHRSCKPIDEIVFKPKVNAKELQLGFGVECEGVCGV